MKQYVYLFNVEGTDVYKIGNSKHPDKRASQVQTSCPYKVHIVFRFESKYSTQVESALHRKFGLQKKDEQGRELQGEFFYLSTDDKECFMENCQRAEDMFLILENNTYLQDKKKTR